MALEDDNVIITGVLKGQLDPPDASDSSLCEITSVVKPPNQRSKHQMKTTNTQYIHGIDPDGITLTNSD